MNAVVWMRKKHVEVQRVEDPRILNPRDCIEDGRIDPSFVITHRVPLSKAERAYPMFVEKRDNGIKVVLDPTA